MKDTTKPQMARMPWYPESFNGSTCTWPFIAKAVYRALLDAQWMAGGLPDDPDVLRNMLGVTPKDWRIAWPFVGPKFKAGDDGLLRNPRLEAHREKALELYVKQRGGAAKTNAQRWGAVVPLHPEGGAA